MTAYDRLTRFCRDNTITCLRDVSLKEKCSFRIGGLADLFLEPDSEEQIAALLPLLREEGIPWLVLGKGSNVLFSDRGYRGAVIHLGENFAAMEQVSETTITCQSGASLTALCRFAFERGLQGLEFAYGIPGSVGGAVFMNAGAYGGEMKDVLIAARHIAPDGQAGAFAGEALAFSYRRSVYTDTDYAITGATVQLQPGDKDEIRARMEDYLSRRRQKQPLELPSAGSTFKRPAGDYASALIDRCGLKGRAVGGAMVSEKHAGFVVNRGGATCADVLGLIEVIRREVMAQTGIALEPEVKIVEEKKIKFENIENGDPFYSQKTQTRISQAIERLEAGLGVEHELIEDDE
jgi:UDP-N-acetylmuramate dehydrogenase